MFDPTIHARSIARRFEASDFIENKLLLEPAHRQAVIEKAVDIGHVGFKSIALLKNQLRGKDVYRLTDMSDRLVVRHIASNIRRLTKVKQDDREFIIKCIQRILQEGVKCRIYKFDIETFYERVKTEQIVEALENDEGFSGQSAAALRSLFVELRKAGVSGLPRGLGVSATLAEYLLRPFDRRISEMDNVWFYARFVDDIFVITSGVELKSDFVSSASSALPPGLSFNKKSGSLDFDGFLSGESGTAGSFDFLGYRFAVDRPYRRPSDKKIVRNVTLDISEKKVKKIKSRVALSLVNFANDKNYARLHARIRLLTSNFNFVDRRTAVRRVAGIYFNYALIDSDTSVALRDLDAFLRNSLMSNHPRNRLYPALTLLQRLSLARLTFSTGFRQKRFFAFGPVQLVELTSCWSHA